MMSLTSIISDVLTDALPGTDSSDGGADALPSTETPSGNAQNVDATDSSLLTREEQVEEILGAAEGYVWQSDIVAETEWSAAKASRTLSDMEEDGQITRYRIGRRKIVCLPDQEPDCLRVT